MNKKILIVEDELRLMEIMTDYFEVENFIVIQASDGEEALEKFELENIDLVILDIMLPKLDGWSVCDFIRKKSNVPIIMITARSDEEDKLLGFELGADEYVTKPFSPKVLVARTKNLLKRIDSTSEIKTEILDKNGLIIDKLAYRVTNDGENIELAHKEYELLLYLIENEGIVLSRELILNKVWGYDYYGDIRSVDTHIKKLRKKLDSKGQMIKTIIRAGYKFEVDK